MQLQIPAHFKQIQVSGKSNTFWPENVCRKSGSSHSYICVHSSSPCRECEEDLQSSVHVWKQPYSQSHYHHSLPLQLKHIQTPSDSKEVFWWNHRTVCGENIQSNWNILNCLWCRLCLWTLQDMEIYLSPHLWKVQHKYGRLVYLGNRALDARGKKNKQMVNNLVSCQ